MFSRGVGFVNHNHNQHIINKDTMKGNKKYSPLVEIESTVKQLRTELFNKGFALKELLEVEYPVAGAVLSAVEEIKDLLGDICEQWVTAHVVVGGKSRFITDLLVCEVSILLLVCFYCALIFRCIINLVLAQTMLQAILDCAYASFEHYDVNRDVWLTVRTACEDLLSVDDYWRYRELNNRDVFNKHGEETRLDEWETILKKLGPDDKEVRSSDYEGHEREGNSISSAKSLFPVPQGQACSISGLSRVLGKYIFLFLHDVLLS